eukprot:CAMPEP_0180713254 /NCGR_PEP_ID=MMETSP1038_2-20121128/11793_1 /TAXON_ID=632150 /ORGANISM="Azadinium spinosum, Strain 3D9" /LENGTH=102 /DNA_ID=CAMNT_0022745545 /DNA_START=130 /DNA_END=435 /DNA_ORIENTATION=+
MRNGASGLNILAPTMPVSAICKKPAELGGTVPPCDCVPYRPNSTTSHAAGRAAQAASLLANDARGPRALPRACLSVIRHGSAPPCTFAALPHGLYPRNAHLA